MPNINHFPSPILDWVSHGYSKECQSNSRVEQVIFTFCVYVCTVDDVQFLKRPTY